MADDVIMKAQFTLTCECQRKEGLLISVIASRSRAEVRTKASPRHLKEHWKGSLVLHILFKALLLVGYESRVGLAVFKQRTLSCATFACNIASYWSRSARLR